jgi:hypothetical protein
LASTEDYLALFAATGAAVLNGALDRVRHSYMAWEFSRRCVCKADPNAQPPAGGASQSFTACGVDYEAGTILWGSPNLPAGTTSVTLAQTATRVNGQAVQPPTAYYLGFALYRPPLYPQNYPGGSPWMTVAGGGATMTGTMVLDPTYTGPFVIGITQPSGTDHTWCWDFTITYNGAWSPTAYVGPGTWTPPSNFPMPDSCTPVASFADVGTVLCSIQQQLQAISQKLDYLSRITSPPTYTADPAPTPVSGNGIDKPEDAIGVQLTFEPPATVGAFGNNPVTYWDIGWATPITPDGYMPSVRLHYSPQVILPIPPQVTSLAIDTAAGVTASYKWLRAPK